MGAIKTTANAQCHAAAAGENLEQLSVTLPSSSDPACEGEHETPKAGDVTTILDRREQREAEATGPRAAGS